MSAQSGTTYGDTFIFTQTGIVVFSGSGSPEGVQIGSVGDMYTQSDAGGVGVLWWQKATGTATTTGWVAASGASSIVTPLALSRTNGGTGWWDTLDVTARITADPGGSTYVIGTYSQVIVTGNYDLAIMRGVSGEAYAGLDGGKTVSFAQGVTTYCEVDGGAVTNLVGLYVYQNWIDTGSGGSAVANYGILIENQIDGTDNYAFWSGPITGWITGLNDYVRGGYCQNIFMTLDQSSNAAVIMAAHSDDTTADIQTIYGVSYSETAAGTKNYHTGIGVDLYKSGAGTTGIMTGCYVYLEVSDGTVNRAIGLESNGASISGGATVTDNISLLVHEAAGGVANWAIWSEGGANRFDGPLTASVATVETTTQRVGSTDLTDNTATTILTIAMADGARTGGELAFTVEATDASADNDVYTGSVRFTAQRKSSTVTGSIGTIGTGVVTKSHGGADITVTATIDVSSGTSIVLKLNADTALTATTLKAHWNLKMLKGHGAVS